MKPQDLSRQSTPTETLFDLDSLETERGAADFLSVTVRALQKWRGTGTGPKFIRISGRCVRYRRRDLIAWSEAHIKSSTSE
jgi:hypothetical protein